MGRLMLLSVALVVVLAVDGVWSQGVGLPTRRSPDDPKHHGIGMNRWFQVWQSALRGLKTKKTTEGPATTTVRPTTAPVRHVAYQKVMKLVKSSSTDSAGPTVKPRRCRVPGLLTQRFTPFDPACLQKRSR